MKITKTIRKAIFGNKKKMSTEFVPYRKKLELQGVNAHFFYGTSQAKTWYDPLKSYAKLEYDWVLENVELQGKKIIDGGAHHGQYALIFAKGAKDDCQLIAIDPFPMNCLFTEINMRLNNSRFEIIQAAISTKEGITSFTNRSNGQISDEGELKVKTCTLRNVMPNVEVIKLDVEGHEFSIIPHEIDNLPNIETWIIEVHPSKKNRPDDLIQLFKDRNYKILWVNRDANIVEEYTMGTQWDIHSTIFCIKN